MEKPKISLLLTVISLGTRVALAYAFAPAFGVEAIWWAIPIGWALADVTGAVLIQAVNIGKKKFKNFNMSVDFDAASTIIIHPENAGKRRWL